MMLIPYVMRSAKSPLIVIGSFAIAIFFVSIFRSLAQGTREPLYDDIPGNGPASLSTLHETLHGPVIAQKLKNETLKAELGNAAWKVFHTTFASFPDRPTVDESDALKSYIHLFQRLYPCGECAEHFGQILQQYPPQVSSRSTAAAWGCHVHNEVNRSLGKEMFDCSKIGDFYDCGCGDDEHGGNEDHA